PAWSGRNVAGRSIALRNRLNLYLPADPLPTIWIISRQALAQSRHALAQRFMCSSAGNFSHSVPQASHALAHASHERTAIGPCRDTTCAANSQKSAQSEQVPTDFRWSFLPSATS